MTRYQSIPHNGPVSEHATLDEAYRNIGAPSWLKTLEQVEKEINDRGTCNIVYGFTWAIIRKRESA